MRCQPRRHLALLCLAAGAVAACLPRAAAMPRNNWQEEGTREFVLSGALGSGGGSGGGVIGPDPMNWCAALLANRLDAARRLSSDAAAPLHVLTSAIRPRPALHSRAPPQPQLHVHAAGGPLQPERRPHLPAEVLPVRRLLASGGARAAVCVPG